MQNKRTAASAALLSVLGVSVAGPVGAQVVDAAPPLEELGEPIVVEAPASLPPFSATLTREERMASVAAFQASDYRYGDAVVLSDYWAVESTYQAKVKAGALLLDGDELPFDSRSAAHDAYTASDLTWADSVALGEHWGIESSYEVRIKAGFWLLDGYDPLEIFAAPTNEQLAIDAFFGVGYDYDDAVALADYWGLEFPYDAKIKAGLELKAGAELPAVAQPSVAEDFTLEGLQLDAFFNAGYDYADAVALADYWGETDTYEAKLKAGALIKAGLDVPSVAVPGVTDADLEGGEA